MHAEAKPVNRSINLRSIFCFARCVADVPIKKYRRAGGGTDVQAASQSDWRFVLAVVGNRVREHGLKKHPGNLPRSRARNSVLVASIPVPRSAGARADDD
jgi:hypothetical protein